MTQAKIVSTALTTLLDNPLVKIILDRSEKTPALTHYFLLRAPTVRSRNGRNARQRRGSKLKGACQGAPLNPMFMRRRACHNGGVR